VYFDLPLVVISGMSCCRVMMSCRFLLRCMEYRRGLAMRILSVCMSLSVKRIHCDKIGGGGLKNVVSKI